MTEFKMIDTKDLQIKSLIEFAQTLGYVPVSSERLCQGFQTIDMSTWHTKYISMEDMIKLHDWHLHRVIEMPNGEKVYDFLELKHIDVADSSFTSAKNAKLVEQVKLQRDKSQSDGVKVQNNMVKLTEKGKELYEHLRSL
jgi:hypothetical protein